MHQHSYSTPYTYTHQLHAELLDLTSYLTRFTIVMNDNIHSTGAGIVGIHDNSYCYFTTEYFVLSILLGNPTIQRHNKQSISVF